MIFDTHSHCYFESLLSDIDGVYERARAAGVMQVVQIGCDTESSIAAIALARKYAGWSATVGYHPVDAQDPSVAKNRAGGKVIDQVTPSLDEDIQNDNSDVD
jgi:Tat protein secretion system quality control protein TatD with DNase activity